jgi:hypothetical protein
VIPIPSPKNVLRILVNVCLIGAGASAIAQASHIASGHGRLDWLHDLAIFFFLALVAFALYFIEYQTIRGITKLDLNSTLGYIQSLGCTLLLLLGIWQILYASRTAPSEYSQPGFQENTLLILYVFGHAVFVGNIIWSYVHEGNNREVAGRR